MPKVSILTPTWNRAAFLERVYQGLFTQQHDLIEWIVVDDGSNDETEVIMQNLINISPFPIIYAKFDKRVGKCRADNLLLDLATSDFVLWCDSDDMLSPGSIVLMLSEWDSIPDSQKKDYIGVIGLCTDTEGTIQSTGFHNFKSDIFSCKWYELEQKFKISGDMCILIDRMKIDSHRFPEHDLVITEAGFWFNFFDYKIKYIPVVLKIMVRNTINRISGSKKMQYCRGKAYAIALADSHLFNSFSIFKKIFISSKFHRYCIHGDISVKDRSKLFVNKDNFYYKIGLLIGLLQASRDILLGRVDKTHLIFENGRLCNPTIFKSQIHQ